jgi:hypothetical protein
MMATHDSVSTFVRSAAVMLMTDDSKTFLRDVKPALRLLLCSNPDRTTAAAQTMIAVLPERTALENQQVRLMFTYLASCRSLDKPHALQFLCALSAQGSDDRAWPFMVAYLSRHVLLHEQPDTVRTCLAIASLHNHRVLPLLLRRYQLCPYQGNVSTLDASYASLVAAAPAVWGPCSLDQQQMYAYGA